MNIKVAVCTFNPQIARLTRVLSNIRDNSLPVELILIENGISTQSCRRLAKDFNANYIHIQELGTARARFAALQRVNDGELLIFVDDDNYVDSNYFLNALSIHKRNPELGMFSGKLSIPEWYSVERRHCHLLPFLAIRNLGENEIISSPSRRWNIIEPPTAGAVLHWKLCQRVVTEIESGNTSFFTLGARGKRQLRGEDSYLARKCLDVNLNWGYFPQLTLVHDFGSRRLNLKYLTKLLFWMGVSDVALDRALKVEPIYPYPSSFFETMRRLNFFIRDHNSSWVLVARSLGNLLASRTRFF